MPKSITIDLLPDGSVSIEADGYVGKSCEEATKSFIEALGGKVTSQNFKPEHLRQEVPVVKEVKRTT